MHPSRTGMDQHDNPFRESRMSDIPSRNRLIFRAPVGSTRAYEDGVQDRRDMYNFISRQSRIEPSRIEDGENPPQRQGQVDAIHVLHGDGRNSTRQQQLIERFQRDRNQSQERQRPTPSFWGDVEGDNEGSQFFPSRPRHLARSGRGVTGFDRYHPTVDISRSARTNPTAPGPTSRHRPLSHSPVRDDSSRHERLIAVARLRARLHLDSESLSGNLPRMELFNHPTPRRRGRAFGDYMVCRLYF